MNLIKINHVIINLDNVTHLRRGEGGVVFTLCGTGGEATNSVVVKGPAADELWRSLGNEVAFDCSEKTE